MPSAEYTTLSARLDDLTRTFVDFDIPVDRNPEPKELDMIASFKLLMHAELETFIEDRVSFAVRQSLDMWINRKLVTKCLLNLVIRWYPYFEKDKNIYSLPPTTDVVKNLLELCSRRANDEIRENNGIKQHGFTKLAYSAGFLAEDLSGTLLASLESYGKTRGDVAHAAVGRVQTLKDPRVEASEAKQLVELLKQFDEDIIDITTP